MGQRELIISSYFPKSQLRRYLICYQPQLHPRGLAETVTSPEVSCFLQVWRGFSGTASKPHCSLWCSAILRGRRAQFPPKQRESGWEDAQKARRAVDQRGKVTPQHPRAPYLSFGALLGPVCREVSPRGAKSPPFPSNSSQTWRFLPPHPAASSRLRRVSRGWHMWAVASGSTRDLVHSSAPGSF